MSFGFNTDVLVGEELFHVQTEPCARPQRAIETTVFQNGSVQYLHRTELPEPGSDSGVEPLIREQHARVIQELKTGALRGTGPELELEWLNREEPATAGHLRVRVQIRREGRPVPGCRVAMQLASGPVLFARADTEGIAELQAQLPPDPVLVLLLQAEQGLSVGTRKYRVAKTEP